MLIKSRKFSATKCEGTYEKDGFGWAPGQEKRFEGTQANSTRYTKNYSQMTGVCKKCDKYKGKSSTDGSHCTLPINEHCQA